tara:strand:- start:118 stop:261 length:144 start_codon:yes stop_codon:yes gene_type:complete
MKFYPVFDVKLQKKEKKYVNNYLSSSRITQGKYINIFEKKLIKIVGE